ncbi:MAG: CPXCG motif-containing cysteine-rich protein [Flavobacteriaceae bacterium]|nr:MAG: CPXCG motif-containing cysteine-rich protein [Flavobacteriaceae bacterium]
MKEQFSICPHCWEEISMLLDTSVSSQTYIEDCEVCCNPIQVEVECSQGEITYFNLRSIDQ